jgi:hypothetical protein
MTTRGTWKASERRMASLLGGERVPVTGRGRGSAPDIDGVTWAGRRLSIEHKYGQRILSARIGTAIEQARAACRGDTDVALVTIEETGLSRTNVRMVLVDAGTIADVIEWYEARIRALESRAPIAAAVPCARCGGLVVIGEPVCMLCGRGA